MLKWTFVICCLCAFTVSQHCLTEFNTYFDVALTPKGYMFVGMCGSNDPKLFLSTDDTATSWNNLSHFNVTISLLSSVTYGNGMYVVVGGVQKILVSKDAKTWTWIENIPGNKNFFFHLVRYVKINETKSMFFTGASFGEMLMSEDAINWTLIPKSEDQQEMYSFASDGNGTVVCVGGKWGRMGPAVYTKDPTLMNWKQGTIDIANIYLHDVVYSNKRKMFVAVGDLSANPDYAGVMVSKDGIAWKSVYNVSHDYEGKVTSVTYSEELDIFYAVGNGIYYSGDGFAWTRIDDSKYPSKLDRVHWLTGIHLSPKRFVIVGNYNIVWVSTDQGKTWTQTGPK